VNAEYPTRRPGIETKRVRPEHPLLSIVIPVFNEAETLHELSRRILEASRRWDLRWEVIFVDDGSSDATLDILRTLNDSDPRFKISSFSRNFGHQIAVTAGLARASGDAVVVMDADLQDPPEVLEVFLDRWRNDYDVVYGIRTKRKENAVLRATNSIYYRVLQLLADIRIPLDSGDFCLMDRRVVSALNRVPERRRYVRGLRSWVGFRQTGVPYERAARVSGKSKYTLSRMFKLAWDGVLSFSFKPLSLIYVAGLLTAGLSFLGLLFFFVHRVAGFKIYGYAPQDVPGFTSVIFSILFIGGIQLLALGILGKYIAQIAEEVKGRPLYIEKEVVGFGEESGRRQPARPAGATSP
jgi:glycosyltransferase involved in cell wall biosynthesis